MKISRQDQKEKSKTTAWWLYEFAYDLEKNAQNIDYLKDYLDKKLKSKQFNTIEEKLADIRERIGFDLARKITNEIEKLSQIKESTAAENCACNNSSSESCSCPVKTAMKHPERDVEIMGNILNYIKDMVKHEPHLDSATIISRCKDEEGLRFGDIEKRIDKGKLVSYINDLADSKVDGELAKYVPSDQLDVSSEDDIAEYYNHAEPSLQ